MGSVFLVYIAKYRFGSNSAVFHVDEDIANAGPFKRYFHLYCISELDVKTGQVA